MKYIIVILPLLFFNSCKDIIQEKKVKPSIEKKAYQPTYSPSFLMGQFKPEDHPDFVLIDEKHTDRSGRYMHNLAYEAFIKMYDAALADNINLQIISAARNFDYQKGIWERKWKGQTLLEGAMDATKTKDSAERARLILRFSSMPGTSRHHWGTDIDFNSLNNSFFESGEGKRIFDWLNLHAFQYGFCRSYTAKGPETRTTGYEEEKWHWSYYPLSSIMLYDAKMQLKDTMITGFLGSKVAGKIEVVDHYILGVDITCLPSELSH